ncbi:MAG: Rmf/CrpP family protein [Pseudomonadaceae bacterium]
MMIDLHELEAFGEQSGKTPFDIGFAAGMSGRTLFDCPYGHATAEALRQRHQWLEGYLTALANSAAPGFF